MAAHVEVDVVVVGGGSAGVAAAVTAAEEGARTLLLESSGAVGGTLAWQLLEHSAGFHDEHGTRLVAGFGQTLVDRLRRLGGSPGHIRDDVGYTATRTPVDHALLALIQSIMLAEAGAAVWPQTAVVGVHPSPDAAIAALRVHTPEGHRTVHAPAVVDCTGDAAVAWLAGVPLQPDLSRRQPASLLFKLAGVDVEPLLAYLREHPGELRPGSVLGSATSEHLNLWGLGGLLAEGHQTGALSLLRSELHLAAWPRRGEVVVNVTRVPAGAEDGWRGKAHAQLSRQVLEFLGWFRTRVPGFASCHLTGVADRVGVRESRRIVGAYTLSAADLRSGARFVDAIGCGGFPIDIHASNAPGLSHADPVGGGYEIPYRALHARHCPNLLVAGRCISSTHEANGSVRITATCFVTGEAAGAAAALAARDARHAAEVNVETLQETLNRRGAVTRLPARVSVP